MSNRFLFTLGALLVFLLAVTGSNCAGPQGSDQEWSGLRQELVRKLAAEGITDQRVLNAIGETPRHAFVPDRWRALSYTDRPLPIGKGQTISQPFIVAFMCQALKLSSSDKVLEIGTGSGYHAAVLSLLCQEVYTIEIIADLGLQAEKLLDSLQYHNVTVRIGDGYQGWVEEQPFDAIILTAAPKEIPQPLKDQLKVGGRLIAPVGDDWQELVLLEKTEEGFKQKALLPVVFVPMTGKAAGER